MTSRDPAKVKLVNPVRLESNILKTARYDTIRYDTTGEFNVDSKTRVFSLI